MGMLKTEQKNSRAWLIDVLIEALKRSSQPESCGAARVLTYIVDDEHPKVKEVQNLILDSSPSRFNCIFSSEEFFDEGFGVMIQRRSERIPNWLIKATIDVLLSERWRHLSEEGLSGALEVLRFDEGRSLQAVKSLGLKDYEISLLEELLQDNNSKETRQISYGDVKIELPKNDWTTGTFEIKSWREALPNLSEKGAGVILLVDKIFRFANEQTTQNLRDVVDCVNGNFSLLSALPYHLQFYLPLEFNLPQNLLFNEVSSLDLKSFKKLLKTGELGSTYIAKPLRSFSLMNKMDMSPEEFTKVKNDFPYVAFISYCYEIDYKMRSVPDAERLSYLRDATELIFKSKHLVNRVPQLWGDLLERAGGRADELRRTIVECAEEIPDHINVTALLNGGTDSGYLLPKLPEEGVLLPHLLQAVSRSSPIPMRFLEEGRSPEVIRKRASLVASDKKLLELIATGTEYGASIRVAAIIFLLLLGDKDKLDTLAEVLREFYAKGFEQWFLYPLLKQLEESPHDDEVRRFTGKLLDIARENPSDRTFIQDHLLNIWREKSSAPVQGNDLLNEWLSG